MEGQNAIQMDLDSPGSWVLMNLVKFNKAKEKAFTATEPRQSQAGIQSGK